MLTLPRGAKAALNRRRAWWQLRADYVILTIVDAARRMEIALPLAVQQQRDRTTKRYTRLCRVLKIAPFTDPGNIPPPITWHGQTPAQFTACNPADSGHVANTLPASDGERGAALDGGANGADGGPSNGGDPPRGVDDGP